MLRWDGGGGSIEFGDYLYQNLSLTPLLPWFGLDSGSPMAPREVFDLIKSYSGN